MRFGDIKIVLIDFYSYEIGVLETYLEEMALKGWMLEKISKLYIKFSKIEPKNIKYTIDIVDGISENGDLDENLALEYKEKLLNLGWNYSCEFNKLQVFYKEDEYEKNNVSKKERAEKQSILWIKFKGILITLIFLFAVIVFTIFLFDNNQRDFNIKLFMFSSLIGVLLVLYFLQNKKNTIKKKLSIATCFAVAIVSILLINNFIVSNIFKNKGNGLKSKQYSLSLKDFNDEVSSEEDIYVDEESSFIANKLFYTANGKKMKLSYELFESDYKWMINWNFNKMMNWFEKQGISYNEIKINLPNEVKVYTNDKKNNYIMLSSNKVIEVIGIDEIDNKEEVLNIVYNKIFVDNKEELI